MHSVRQAGRTVRERTLRLKAIRRLIKSHRIDSQERLLQHLGHEGFVVTQATLSRDLKLLKVSKVSEGVEGYYYTLPSEEQEREAQQNYIQDFVRGYVSIDFSGNLCVIRTLTGHADSLALALDSLGIEEILGTVAGDDTVLVVLRENVGADGLIAAMRHHIPDFEE